MRYIIKLSYDGSPFSGWQRQNNAVTIQDELSKALTTLTGCETEAVGAGRTDSGVNATGYVAHFDLPGKLPLEAEQLCYKLNAILPREIVVHTISPADDEFHARFGATLREYHYFIHRCKDPFAEKFSWLCHYPLDIDAMNKAAAYLVGEHDFSCFEKLGGGNKTSVCTVFDARWETYSPDHCSLLGFPCQEGDYIFFRISANRFLRNMVRAIVGSLVEVGRGRQSPQWVEELIAGGSRSDAGESVPGKALFLNKIEY